MNLIKKKVRSGLQLIGTFSMLTEENTNSIAQELRPRIKKMRPHEADKLCMTQGTIIKAKRQPTEWEKVGAERRLVEHIKN